MSDGAPTTITQFDQIRVLDNATISTPAGYAWLRDAEVECTSTASIVQSRTQWSGGMIAVSCIVGLFTCGLGLILLFLSRQQVTETVLVDTVRVTAPGWSYSSQGVGGATFVSYVTSWQHQLRAGMHAVVQQLPAEPKSIGAGDGQPGRALDS